MESVLLFAPYVIIMALVWAGYSVVVRRKEKRALAIRDAAVEAGLGIPISLHPIIDPVKCLGCATCTRACPEGDVLGIINGKAQLIEPSHCIGHGACKSACPTQAISLVFGTAERGVDLPVVGPDFQSNVPGLFVAGELGGMGLIRNATEQGKQAVSFIRKLPAMGQGNILDLIIIGAGPAGIAAALAAKQGGLRYQVLEQDDLGGTVFKYPRGKVVMTAPATLPIVGKMNFKRVGKEELLAFWRKIEKQQKLRINYRQRVTAISRTAEHFTVKTESDSHDAHAVLLAIGRRGTPRQLGVPGEDLPKVVYQMIDAAQYQGKNVLVVGGGDSAIEAATSMAQQPGCHVTLSYRGSGFGRARQANRDAITKMATEQKLTLAFSSNVKVIREDIVELEMSGKHYALDNDAVIVCAGGILPTEFLRNSGIEVETKYGTA